MGNPAVLREDRAQLTRYVNALRAEGWNAEKGTSFRPTGNVKIPIGPYNVVLYSSSDPQDAGLIFYEIQWGATGEQIHVTSLMAFILFALAWLRTMGQMQQQYGIP